MDAEPIKSKWTFPVLVDVSMILAMLSLAFWVGKQADKIDNVVDRVTAIQTQMSDMNRNDTRSDIAALKERSNNQNQQILDLKDLIIRRMDRIEIKLDGAK